MPPAPSASIPGAPGHKKPSFLFAITALLLIVGIIAGGIIFFKLQLQLLMLTGWVACSAGCSAVPTRIWKRGPSS